MRLVLCNAPADRAEPIARALVERRLAACVNVVPGVVSFYRWDGAIQRDAESTLLIKTTAERMDELTKAIRQLHPYEVPEVISVALSAEGNADYLQWVRRETEAG